MIAADFLSHGAKVYISSRKADVCDATAKRKKRVNAGRGFDQNSVYLLPGLGRHSQQPMTKCFTTDWSSDGKIVMRGFCGQSEP